MDVRVLRVTVSVQQEICSVRLIIVSLLHCVKCFCSARNSMTFEKSLNTHLLFHSLININQVAWPIQAHKHDINKIKEKKSKYVLRNVYRVAQNSKQLPNYQ